MLICGADGNDKIYPVLVDTAGRLIVVMRGADTPVRKYAELGAAGETTIWDPTSGTKFVITDIVVSAGETSGVTFKDGTAGTTFLTHRVLKDTVAVINFQTPIVSTTANNNLTGTNTAGTTYVTVSGYEL